MKMPLVNVFATPYMILKYPSAEEILANISAYTFPPQGQIVGNIKTSKEAAVYIANEGLDNGLGNFINEALDTSLEYKIWQNSMPPATPQELCDYQSKYPHCDLAAVDGKIAEHGHSLSNGQVLFHGGVWPEGEKAFVTDRPLSTTFCPQVALREAEFRGKAYDAERIDLFVLRVQNCSSKVFVYSRHDGNFAHENEVLFSSGVTLTLRGEKLLVRNDYSFGKADTMVAGKLLTRTGPVYVLDIDIS